MTKKNITNFLDFLRKIVVFTVFLWQFFMFMTIQVRENAVVTGCNCILRVVIKKKNLTHPQGSI